MTTVSFNYDFLATIVIGDELIPNHYFLDIELHANTHDLSEQAIAFERMRVMAASLLHNTLIMDLGNPLAEVLIEHTKNPIMFLPDEPYDQLLTILLHSKFNAILEERMFVNKLMLKSSQGDMITYTFNAMFDEYPEIVHVEIVKGSKAWWARGDMATMDMVEKEEDEEPTLVEPDISWDEVGLAWDAIAEKEGKVIDITKFKPKLVEGKNNENSDGKEE